MASRTWTRWHVGQNPLKNFIGRIVRCPNVNGLPNHFVAGGSVLNPICAKFFHSVSPLVIISLFVDRHPLPSSWRQTLCDQFFAAPYVRASDLFAVLLAFSFEMLAPRRRSS
jgi:hypothetical protein